MVVMRWAKFQMWDVRKRDQIQMEECTLRQPYLLSFWKIGTFLWKIEFRQFLTLGHTTSCNKSVKKANETLLRKTMYTQTENGTDSIWIMRTPLHRRPIKCFQMRLIYTTIIKKNTCYKYICKIESLPFSFSIPSWTWSPGCWFGGITRSIRTFLVVPKGRPRFF